MKKFLMISVFTIFLVVSCVAAPAGPAKAELPAGKGYSEGGEIYFIHTEASDQGIADKLTNMMKSPVLYVPALKDTPSSTLANVYVFTNGIAGSGPLGFQPDVFDNPPGTSGYSPLRSLNTVTWVNPQDATLFKNTADILSAKLAGNISIDQPGIVINMPFIIWNGGKR